MIKPAAGRIICLLSRVINKEQVGVNAASQLIGRRSLEGSVENEQQIVVKL